LDVAIKSKGRPVVFYGPISFVASSVIQIPAYLQARAHTHTRTHTSECTTLGTIDE